MRPDSVALGTEKESSIELVRRNGRLLVDLDNYVSKALEGEAGDIIVTTLNLGTG